MLRFIVPIILIAVAVGVFLVFTNPLYIDVLALRAGAASYKEALGNSKALENERDKLTQKFNSIDPAQLVKLEKMLPENVDNIRLILEIEKVALPYGMILREVKYNTEEAKERTTQTGNIGPSAPAESVNPDYGTWTLQFSASTTYPNFINFIKDLERNLRIVDIASINFSSGADLASPLSGIYRFGFEIKTYWLKD